jgi:hypothetical protein
MTIDNIKQATPEQVEALNTIAKAVIDKALDGRDKGLYYDTLLHIKNEVQQQCSAISHSIILNVLNCSTESVSFNVTAIVNGEHEIEIDSDIVKSMYVDIAKLVPKEAIKEAFKSFYNYEMDWNDIDDYEFWFIGFFDIKANKVYAFIGGEDDKPAKFDVLDNLRVIEPFEEGIVIDVQI